VLIWDGEKLSAKWKYITEAKNSKRQDCKKRKLNAFDAMGIVTAGDMLSSFLVETKKLISKYGIKTNLERHVAKLSPKQLIFYNFAVPYVAETMPTSMVMMVTGDGGSGKSFIVQALCKHAFMVHGKSNGRFPNVLIDKKITSILSLTKLIISHDDLDKLKLQLRTTKLIVIEDLQETSLEELYHISSRLCAVSGKDVAFGGYNIVLVGDLLQQPVITLADNGMHVLQRDIPNHNAEAVAAQRMLLDHITHFVDLTTFSTEAADHCSSIGSVPAESFKELLDRAKLNDRYLELVRFVSTDHVQDPQDDHQLE
jgi:hypothetical protein